MSLLSRALRRLLWLLVGLALLYCLLWFGLSHFATRMVRAELDQLANEGRARYETAEITGFPGRFALHLQPLTLADPVTAASWSLPDVTMGIHPWQPNRIGLQLPQEQVLQRGDAALRLRSDLLRATATAGLRPALPLKAATIRGADISAIPEGSARDLLSAQIGGLQIDTKAEDAKGQLQHITATLTDITPDAAAKARIDRRNILPETAERLHLDLVLGFDRPLDRFALEVTPRPQEIRLRDLSLLWGPLNLKASGALGPDAQGQLSGRIDIDAGEWREILELAVSLGLINPEVAPTYGKALEALAKLTGGSDRHLKVPLVLKGGWISLGPLPLGPAPRL